MGNVIHGAMKRAHKRKRSGIETQAQTQAQTQVKKKQRTSRSTKKRKKKKKKKKRKNKKKNANKASAPSRILVYTMERFLQMILTSDRVAIKHGKRDPVVAVAHIRLLWRLFVSHSDFSKEAQSLDVCRYIKKRTFPLMAPLIKRERFRGRKFGKTFKSCDDLTGNVSAQVIHGFELKYPVSWASNISGARYAFEYILAFGFGCSNIRYASFVNEAKKLCLPFANAPQPRDTEMTPEQEDAQNWMEFQKEFTTLNQKLMYNISHHSQLNTSPLIEAFSRSDSECLNSSDGDMGDDTFVEKVAYVPRENLSGMVMNKDLGSLSSECDIDVTVKEGQVSVTAIGCMKPDDDYDIVRKKVGKVLRQRGRKEARENNARRVALVECIEKARDDIDGLEGSSSV